MTPDTLLLVALALLALVVLLPTRVVYSPEELIELDRDGFNGCPDDYA